MNCNRFSNLEVLAATPAGATDSPPLLFIHGAYTAAWCWSEHFLPFFAAAGFPAYALSLSGHGGSRGRDCLDQFSIEDYVDDVAEVAAGLSATPVVIGHSMGGFVVQKYLARHEAAAAVLACSVPPQGLFAAALGLAFSQPNLFQDLNRLMAGHQVALDTLRDALFAQPVDLADLERFYRGSQPESYRAIWDMTLFNLPPSGRPSCPILVLGSEKDRLIPQSAVHMTARSYGVTAEIFPGLGHGLMLERDWRKVAQRILDWLRENLS